MNIIESLNRKMPTLLKIDDDIYKAIFGKEVFSPELTITESSDYNCGAIVNELEYLRGFINEWSTKDISSAEEKVLEALMNFFINISRIWDETDTALKNRFYSLIRRKENKRWTTKWCMKDVFKYYFSAEDIYIIENYIETNLLLNGDFEDGLGNVFTNWNKTEAGSSVIVEATLGDQFEGDRCPEFQIDSSNSNASLDQTKNGVTAGDYKLDVFYWDDGDCPDDDVVTLQIQRSSDSFWYKFSDNTWQVGEIGVDLPKVADWTYYGHYIKNDGTENLKVIIKNKGAAGIAYKFRVDIVEFGEWKTYPSFKVLILASSDVGLYMSVWNGSKEDNLMDRGECEETTSPMIFNETVPFEPTPANQTWARDNNDPYMGSYNWRLTKDVAAAAGDAETFLTDNKNTTDMHGLVADTKYTLAFRGNPDEITNAHKVRIHEYYSAAWHETEITLDAAGSWKRYSQTITLNASTTGFAISVFIDTDAAQNSTLDIDNIRLIEGEDSDIEKASFFDNDFMMGAGAGYSESLYENLLKRIKPWGVKEKLEFIYS